ncbi:hypothetical protein D1970_06635 [Mesobacillus zeae]|uniref:Uncharacterized protein n=1 Tax=Mesobacillus zeae TaxID=1917180 RepID=A0A398BG61_9BACI|nr:hypothetical protein D1970_06635 [Mesobacillus zeae]
MYFSRLHLFYQAFMQKGTVPDAHNVILTSPLHTFNREPDQKNMTKGSGVSHCLFIAIDELFT